MRNALVTAALLLTAALLPAVANAQVAPDDQAFFDKHLTDIVTLDATPLHNDAIATVFNVPAFLAKLNIHQGSETQTMNLFIAKTDSQLISLATPSTDEDLPQLKSLISSKFKLKTADDAKAFEKVVDVIDPIPDTSPDDQKAKAIAQQGTQWTFIRGAFFTHHKGYVLMTDADGNVTAVKYSLNLP